MLLEGQRYRGAPIPHPRLYKQSPVNAEKRHGRLLNGYDRVNRGIVRGGTPVAVLILVILAVTGFMHRQRLQRMVDDDSDESGRLGGEADGSEAANLADQYRKVNGKQIGQRVDFAIGAIEGLSCINVLTAGNSLDALGPLL